MSRTSFNDVIFVLLLGIVLIIIGMALSNYLIVLEFLKYIPTDWWGTAFQGHDMQPIIGLSLVISGVIIIIAASFAALKRASETS
ncbi:MAG: hypothetical protein ACFFCZ_09515 [Promethearchaeota archaeon]